MKIDDDGNILVKVRDPNKDVAHYDVFNSDGKFINNFKLPALGYYSLFRAGSVYGIKRSSDDYPSVSRYLVE